MKAVTKKKIIKYKAGDSSEVEDAIAEEKKLRISINGKELLRLFFTPTMTRELVVGFLMTEGVAEKICVDRMTINYGEDVEVDVPAEGKVGTEGAFITSGCVGGITFEREPGASARADSFSIGASSLKELFRIFQARSELYNETGCVHSAALSDGHEILCFAEDIGRHNAVDKVIGCAILDGIGFGGKLLMASGRISSEIAGKCARWGIPIVVSKTAPTSLALDIAEKSGVTVVGFVRGDRLNVYTHTERVLKS